MDQGGRVPVSCGGSGKSLTPCEHREMRMCEAANHCRCQATRNGCPSWSLPLADSVRTGVVTLHAHVHTVVLCCFEEMDGHVCLCGQLKTVLVAFDL
eukprot:2475519-Amphidinium_carterae.1